MIMMILVVDYYKALHRKALNCGHYAASMNRRSESSWEHEFSGYFHIDDLDPAEVFSPYFLAATSQRRFGEDSASQEKGPYEPNFPRGLQNLRSWQCVWVDRDDTENP